MNQVVQRFLDSPHICASCSVFLDIGARRLDGPSESVDSSLATRKDCACAYKLQHISRIRISTLKPDSR